MPAFRLGAAVTGDLAVLSLSLGASNWLRTAPQFQPFWTQLGVTGILEGGTWSGILSAILLVQTIAIPLGLWTFGQYRLHPHRGPLWGFERILAVVTLAQLGAIGMLAALRLPFVPRLVLILDFVFLVIGLTTWRAIGASLAAHRLEQGQGLHNVLIIGHDHLAQSLAGEFLEHLTYGRRVVGFASDQPLSLDQGLHDFGDRFDVWIPDHAITDTTNSTGHHLSQTVIENVQTRPRHLLARVADLSEEQIGSALDGLLVDEVFLTGHPDFEAVKGIMRQCETRGIDVHVVPPHYPGLAMAAEPWRIGDYTVISLHKEPIPELGRLAKRLMDIAGAVVGLMLAIPIALVAGLAIKIEDHRLPVLFGSRRLGLGGRSFKMWKFNTMRPHSKEDMDKLAAENVREGPWFKIVAEKDPRITRVGRVLRKYTINEIPQFWNVLKGEMSLVGPRPPLPDEVADYVNYDFRYYRCLEVKPGLSSLWAVKARDDPSFERRIELDLEYINHWSLWLDFKVMFLTFWTVFTTKEE